jgi:hypothetical protein
MVAACQYTLDRGAVATQLLPVTLSVDLPCGKCFFARRRYRQIYNGRIRKACKVKDSAVCPAPSSSCIALSESHRWRWLVRSGLPDAWDRSRQHTAHNSISSVLAEPQRVLAPCDSSSKGFKIATMKTPHTLSKKTVSRNENQRFRCR